MGQVFVVTVFAPLRNGVRRTLYDLYLYIFLVRNNGEGVNELGKRAW